MRPLVLLSRIAGPVVLVVFAGCTKGASKASVVAPSCPTCVTVDGSGFTPSSVTLPKGAAGSKSTVTFTRTTDDTCATRVDFPEVGIKKELPLGTSVTVDVPTDAERTLTFQCGMGMYKSSVVVR
ncbi:MAG: cupredoxin domain-containing protein [Polyangiaceae bacterium]